MTELLSEVILAGTAPRLASVDSFLVERADTRQIAAYHRLRREVFVVEQAMFGSSDRDDVDDDPRTVVLVARTPEGEVLGGVRIHPMLSPDQGWWRGSRLAVTPDARSMLGVGAALVRAACAEAETCGALRFDATVQSRNGPLFARLGWVAHEPVVLHGEPHVRMEWPIASIQRLVDQTKSALGSLVGGLVDAPGFEGDDGTPVAGTDMVAACDAIVPSMVERDPEWAGWCAVLVNVNDLFAMGARPVGLLDAIGARDTSFARRIVRGIAQAARAWDVPVLGGHTQLGVPAALSVTALGRTAAPVPGGGGQPGQAVRLTADLGGAWRPGYHGGQWDSSSHRTSAELRELHRVVPALHPSAAKDVSMSGLVGTTGMLAEASGCGAVLDVADVPAPDGARTADWFTCFPGFAMVTTEAPAARAAADLPAFLTSAVCGRLTDQEGVWLRWPDGAHTRAVAGPVTGLGSVTSAIATSAPTRRVS